MTDEEVKTEFSARQSEQRSISYKAIAVALIGYLATLVVPCSVKQIIYVILIAYVGFALYKTFKLWRCPVCDRLLGDRIDLDACPHCLAKFR